MVLLYKHVLQRCTTDHLPRDASFLVQTNTHPVMSSMSGHCCEHRSGHPLALMALTLQMTAD